MPTLEITERIDSFVRYKITHDDGRIEHGHLNAMDAIEEAREKKVSLASVLAKSIDLPDVQPIESKVFIQASDTTVSVDGEIVQKTPEMKFVLPEHDHKHDHDLSHEHEPVVAPHDHGPVGEHDHPPEDHSAFSRRLENVEVQAYKSHEHTEIAILVDRLGTLALAVQNLSKLLEGHNHPQYGLSSAEHTHSEFRHEHEAVPHKHEHEHGPDSESVEAFAMLRGQVGAIQAKAAEPHYHPEILRMVSNAAPAASDNPTGVHVHSFDTMRDDNKGWVCGYCGVSKSEADSGS